MREINLEQTMAALREWREAEAKASPGSAFASSAGSLARIMTAVESEPEMPEAMPRTMKRIICNAVDAQDWEVLEELYRYFVRAAKSNIKNRILETLRQAAIRPENAPMSHREDTL